MKVLFPFPLCAVGHHQLVVLFVVVNDACHYADEPPAKAVVEEGLVDGFPLSGQLPDVVHHFVPLRQREEVVGEGGERLGVV